MGLAMGVVSFQQYRRRVDGWDSRLRHRDMPRDLAELLELSNEIELSDRISVDVSDSLK